MWNKIVTAKITECENSKWKSLLALSPALNRFHAIHSALAPHRLWGMCELYPLANKPLFAIVKLGILPVTAGKCMLCENDCDDIVKHQLLHCAKLVDERNSLSRKLFDNLSVDQYMHYENCDNEEMMIVTLLGGITPIVDSMSLDEWAIFIQITSKCINSWNLKHLLYI
jgi:hypothetical protein